jgi:hypothetical protein
MLEESPSMVRLDRGPVNGDEVKHGGSPSQVPRPFG